MCRQSALLSLFITLAMGTEFDLQEMLNEVQDARKVIPLGEEDSNKEETGVEIRNLIPVHEAAQLEKDAIKINLPYDWNEIIGLTDVTSVVKLLSHEEYDSDMSDLDVFGITEPLLQITEVKPTRSTLRHHKKTNTKAEKAQVEATTEESTLMIRPTKPLDAKQDKEAYGDPVLDFIKSAHEFNRRKGDAFDMYVKPIFNGLTRTDVELKNTQSLPMIEALYQRTRTAPRGDIISNIVASLRGVRIPTKTIPLKDNLITFEVMLPSILRITFKQKFLGTTEVSEPSEINYDIYRFTTVEKLPQQGLKDIKSLLKDAGIDSDYELVTKIQAPNRTDSIQTYDDFVLINKNNDDIEFKRITDDIEVLKHINLAGHRNVSQKSKHRLASGRKKNLKAMNSEMNQKYDDSNKADYNYDQLSLSRTEFQQHSPKSFGKSEGRTPGLEIITSATPPRLDVPGLLEILQNLTNKWSDNAMLALNNSIMRQGQGISTCAHQTTQFYYSDTTTSAYYEHYDSYYERSGKDSKHSGKESGKSDSETDYENYNNVIMGRCYVCGLEEQEIPNNADCSDVFSSSSIWTAKGPRVPKNLASYRKFCRWRNEPHYYYDRSDEKNIYGRWTGGCSVRWIDISGVYTQRSCRNKYSPTRGMHWVSARMTRLELALKNKENGCITSPVASLVPLSRAISLYARFHACVCTGPWCNIAVKQQWTAYFTMLPLIFVVVAF